VKHCPKCGETGTDDDLFCEADGVRLEGSGSSSGGGGSGTPKPPGAATTASVRLARARPCSACGLANADAGDGYCSACGNRLGPVSTTPPLPVGATVAGYEVVSPHGEADFVVRRSLSPSGRSVPAAQGPLGGDGKLLVMAFGAAPEIGLEADALEAMARQSRPLPAFPRLIERGSDADWGPFLAFLPVLTSRPLAEVAASLALPDVVALLDDVMDAAEAVSAAGFGWEPLPQDFRVNGDGSLALSRLRIAHRLAPGKVADVRAVMEAVGTLLLPLPAALGPARLGRLLAGRMATSPDLALGVVHAREALGHIVMDLAPPDGPHELADLVDAGLKRDHNEDATAIASGVLKGEPWAVLVVCDGVSSSTHADRASKIASTTTRDALAHFLRSGDVAFEGAQSAMATAIRAAHVAVCATPIDALPPRGPDAPPSPGPPGTTIVAAIVFRHRVIVGWVGDSRAYWVTEAGAELLTRDHSWVNETVAKGEMTEAEAMVAPLAHALTRCLGPLEVGEGGQIQEIEPEVRVRDLPGAGDLVLCTDGLWNYFPSAPEVAGVVQAAGPDASAGLLARCLVNHALWRGGGDNVSVAVYKHK